MRSLLCFLLLLAPFARAADPAATAPAQLPLMGIVKTFDVPIPQKDHTRTVDYLLALSPDDKTLVIAAAGQVTAVDVATEKEIWSMPIVDAPPAVMQFTPDGKGLLIGRTDHVKNQRETPTEILTLDPATGKTLRSIEGPHKGIWSITSSPDGKQLLVRGGSDYSFEGTSISLLDSATGKQIIAAATDTENRRLRTPRAANFLSGDKFFATITPNEGLFVHDLATGNAVKRFKLPRDNYPSFVVGGDANRVIAGNASGMIAYDLNTEKPLWQLDYEFQYRYHDARLISPDRILAVGKQISILDANTGEEISWVPNDLRFNVSSVGGKYIAGIQDVGKVAEHTYKIVIAGLPGVVENVKLDPAAKPLFTAARDGNTPRLRALLARDPDLKAAILASGKGESILHVVTDVETAKFLIDLGADVNAVYNKATPLHTCINRFYPSKIETPRLAFIDLLIAHGAKTEVIDSEGYTPLQRAAKEGYHEVARHLIDKGATFDIYSAVILGDAARVTALLKENPQRANAPWSTQFNRTAIFLATDIPTIDALIAGGADLTAVDNRGQNIAYVFDKAKHPDLVKYVLSKGAPAPASRKPKPAPAVDGNP